MQQWGLERVGFVELFEVGFEVVKGWLGVLLGGFAIERSGGGFYEGAEIFVGPKREEIAESLCGEVAC